MGASGAEEFTERLFIAAPAPEGVAEKMALAARLKACPDTNRKFFIGL
jgi:hypothetical protein